MCVCVCVFVYFVFYPFFFFLKLIIHVYFQKPFKTHNTHLHLNHCQPSSFLPPLASGNWPGLDRRFGRGRDASGYMLLVHGGVWPVQGGQRCACIWRRPAVLVWRAAGACWLIVCCWQLVVVCCVYISISISSLFHTIFHSFLLAVLPDRQAKALTI